MFGFFGGGKKNKKKGRRRGRKAEREQKNLDENKLTGIEFWSHSIKGMGTKKLENQDSFTIIDTQEPFYYFFAVLDGHGSSGREGEAFGFFGILLLS